MGGLRRARPKGGSRLRGSIEELFTAFLDVARYRNAAEWNRAVALCEALAERGWGDHEPVEAVRGKFFNGNPMTMFVNRHGEPRFVDAIWSQRAAGLTMEPGRTSYHASPELPDEPTVLWDHPVVEDVRNLALATQRNWIAKNPIHITRGIDNCYPANRPLIDGIEALVAMLDREMRPERYGRELQRIRVVCDFSYFDHDSNKCNYVPIDEERPLSKAELQRRLEALYSAAEIAEFGYFARNKIELGRFSRDRAILRVVLYFSKELAERSDAEQRRCFAADLERAIGAAINRLRGRIEGYDLEAMSADFAVLLERWVRTAALDAMPIS